jgi:hypothetical protein
MSSSSRPPLSLVLAARVATPLARREDDDVEELDCRRLRR